MTKRVIFLFLLVSFTVSTLAYALSEPDNEAESEEKIAIANQQPKIFAHRGANDRFNESTLTAYKIASLDGVDALEIDLRMTKDGELVAMHDQTIDRTTNGSGKVSDYTMKELQSFPTTGKVGNKAITEEIPSLKEIIETFTDTEHYYIETRLLDGQAVMENQLLHLLDEYELIEKELVIIQSFEQKSLEKINKEEPDIPLTLLYRKDKFQLSEAKSVPYPIIGIESSDVTLNTVNELHKSGKEVHVYFTNQAAQKEEQKRVKEFNVDGYFTDDIRYTKELLGK